MSSRSSRRAGSKQPAAGADASTTVPQPPAATTANQANHTPVNNHSSPANNGRRTTRHTDAGSSSLSSPPSSAAPLSDPAAASKSNSSSSAASGGAAAPHATTNNTSTRNSAHAASAPVSGDAAANSGRRSSRLSGGSTNAAPRPSASPSPSPAAVSDREVWFEGELNDKRTVRFVFFSRDVGDKSSDDGGKDDEEAAEDGAEASAAAGGGSGAEEDEEMEEETQPERNSHHNTNTLPTPPTTSQRTTRAASPHTKDTHSSLHVPQPSPSPSASLGSISASPPAPSVDADELMADSNNNFASSITLNRNKGKFVSSKASDVLFSGPGLNFTLDGAAPIPRKTIPIPTLPTRERTELEDLPRFKRPPLRCHLSEEKRAVKLLSYINKDLLPEQLIDANCTLKQYAMVPSLQLTTGASIIGGPNGLMSPMQAPRSMFSAGIGSPHALTPGQSSSHTGFPKPLSLGTPSPSITAKPRKLSTSAAFASPNFPPLPPGSPAARTASNLAVAGLSTPHFSRHTSLLTYPMPVPVQVGPASNIVSQSIPYGEMLIKPTGKALLCASSVPKFNSRSNFKSWYLPESRPSTLYITLDLPGHRDYEIKLDNVFIMPDVVDQQRLKVQQKLIYDGKLVEMVPPSFERQPTVRIEQSKPSKRSNSRNVNVNGKQTNSKKRVGGHLQRKRTYRNIDADCAAIDEATMDEGETKAVDEVDKELDKIRADMVLFGKPVLRDVKVSIRSAGQQLVPALPTEVVEHVAQIGADGLPSSTPVTVIRKVPAGPSTLSFSRPSIEFSHGRISIERAKPRLGGWVVKRGLSVKTTRDYQAAKTGEDAQMPPPFVPSPVAPTATLAESKVKVEGVADVKRETMIVEDESKKPEVLPVKVEPEVEQKEGDAEMQDAAATEAPSSPASVASIPSVVFGNAEELPPPPPFDQVYEPVDLLDHQQDIAEAGDCITLVLNTPTPPPEAKSKPILPMRYELVIEGIRISPAAEAAPFPASSALYRSGTAPKSILEAELLSTRLTSSHVPSERLTTQIKRHWSEQGRAISKKDPLLYPNTFLPSDDESSDEDADMNVDENGQPKLPKTAAEQASAIRNKYFNEFPQYNYEEYYELAQPEQPDVDEDNEAMEMSSESESEVEDYTTTDSESELNAGPDSYRHERHAEDDEDDEDDDDERGRRRAPGSGSNRGPVPPNAAAKRPLQLPPTNLMSSKAEFGKKLQTKPFVHIPQGSSARNPNSSASNSSSLKAKRVDMSVTQAASDSSNQHEAVWAACDKCGKWRKMPAGTRDEDLPAVWYCKMNTDPLHNSCKAPEESDPDSVDTVLPAGNPARTKQKSINNDVDLAAERAKVEKAAAEAHLASANAAAQAHHEARLFPPPKIPTGEDVCLNCEQTLIAAGDTESKVVDETKFLWCRGPCGRSWHRKCITVSDESKARAGEIAATAAEYAATWKEPPNPPSSHLYSPPTPSTHFMPFTPLQTPYWYCSDCFNLTAFCFSCFKPGTFDQSKARVMEDGSKHMVDNPDLLKQCPYFNVCTKFYHSQCLFELPRTVTHKSSRSTKPNIAKEANIVPQPNILPRTRAPLTCPLHTCDTCCAAGTTSYNVRDIGRTLTQCLYCPTAYHLASRCRQDVELRVISKKFGVCGGHATEGEDAEDEDVRERRAKSIQDVYLIYGTPSQHMFGAAPIESSSEEDSDEEEDEEGEDEDEEEEDEEKETTSHRRNTSAAASSSSDLRAPEISRSESVGSSRKADGDSTDIPSNKRQKTQ